MSLRTNKAAVSKLKKPLKVQVSDPEINSVQAPRCQIVALKLSTKNPPNWIDGGFCIRAPFSECSAGQLRRQMETRTLSGN